MTSREWHVASTVPVAFLAVAVGFHPWVVVPLVAGVLLPEVDTYDESYHRSWLTHTWLAPTIAYHALAISGAFDWVPALVTAVHFVSVGLLLHFVADYVYPREMSHTGAEWPVRPSRSSAPLGLFLLGLSWTLQWFFYLARSFLPWLVP